MGLSILNLGGGVQSTTIVRMILAGELPRVDAVIFADTGWEPKEVYENITALKLALEEAGIPLYVVTAGDIRADALMTGRRFASMPLHVENPDGKPGMLRRQCTNEYKVRPIMQKVREIMGDWRGKRWRDEPVELWFGISLDEAHRMKASRVKYALNVYPLVDRRMTRHGCKVWLVGHGFNVPRKSACLGCPLHSNEEWRNIRENAEEWKSVVDYDGRMRSEGGRIGSASLDGKAFVHHSLIPLELVDLRTEEDFGQQNAFGNECEGLCGV